MENKNRVASFIKRLLLSALVLRACSGLCLASAPDVNQFHEKYSTFEDIGFNDAARSVANDSQNNDIFCGGSEGKDNFCVEKRDPKGAILWKKEIKVGAPCAGRGVAVDKQDNIVVSADMQAGLYVDVLLIKLSPNKDVLWQKVIDHGGKVNGASGLAIDHDGNIVLGGTFNDSGNSYDDDYYMVKMDGSGNELWRQVYATGGHDISSGIAIDSQNNIMQSGQSPYYGLHIVKYTPNGVMLWQKGYYTGYFGEGKRVTVDSHDNIYIAGDYQLGQTYRDIRVIKYAPDGTMLWLRDFNSGALEYPTAINIDANGFVHILGTVWENGANNYDIILIVYDESGNTIGSRRLYTSSYEGVCNAVFDKNWDLVVAGVYETDMWFAKFSYNTNIAPVANAGLNMSVSSKDMTSTIIQGRATDHESDPMNYRWLEGELEISSPQPVGPGGEADLNLATISSLSVGQHVFRLEISDGEYVASDEMILTIDNSSPNVCAGGGGIYPIGAPVSLSGTLSDFDGDPVCYQWLEGTTELCSGTVQTIAGGAPVDIPQECFISNLGLGIHTITIQVTDGINAPVTSETVVQMIDSEAPTLAPVVNPLILWPPNHSMVDVVVQANALDNSGQPVDLSVSVVSNEPIEELGDGDCAPDWAGPIINQEEGIIHLPLRAERSGKGNGREYTISITATDSSGNASIASVKVIVPHDKGKK